jgi:hypothetical protein
MAGRPKGSKNSKLPITPEEFQKAKLMFISGKPMIDIQKELRLSSMNAIYKRMEDEKWLEERQKFFEKSSTKYLDSILKGVISETQEAIEDLKIIRTRAIDPIDAGTLAPRKFSEASSAYMGAVELERKIRTEAIYLSFIAEVAKILKGRITDNQLLAQIGDDLRKLFENSQKDLDAPQGRKLLE